MLGFSPLGRSGWDPCCPLFCGSSSPEAVRANNFNLENAVPIRIGLDAVTFLTHLVGGHEGNDHIGGRRTAFHKRCSRLGSPKIRVVVIKAAISAEKELVR